MSLPLILNIRFPLIKIRLSHNWKKSPLNKVRNICIIYFIHQICVEHHYMPCTGLGLCEFTVRGANSQSLFYLHAAHRSLGTIFTSSDMWC
jgi:hypothetical protein